MECMCISAVFLQLISRWLSPELFNKQHRVEVHKLDEEYEESKFDAQTYAVSAAQIWASFPSGNWNKCESARFERRFRMHELCMQIPLSWSQLAFACQSDRHSDRQAVKHSVSQSVCVVCVSLCPCVDKFARA